MTLPLLAQDKAATESEQERLARRLNKQLDESERHREAMRKSLKSNDDGLDALRETNREMARQAEERLARARANMTPEMRKQFDELERRNAIRAEETARKANRP